MNYITTATSEEIRAAQIGNEYEDEEFEGAHGHESLIEFQTDNSNFETVMFCLLFPLRLLMHLTIPDVRMLDENGIPTATIGKAYLSTLSCLLWLIVGSYAMVASLETLGEQLGISDAIMGFTVSAAGKTNMAILLGSNNHLFVLIVMLNILFNFTFQVHHFPIISHQKLQQKMGSVIRQYRMHLVRIHSTSCVVSGYPGCSISASATILSLTIVSKMNISSILFLS
jgi:hypothetical protein